MKTTIDLPDDLFRKAKIFAAEKRMTMRELVMEGLRMATTTDGGTEERQRRMALQHLLKEMSANNTEPTQPLKREDIHER